MRRKALFLNPAVQCASCHVPPRFTDSVLTPDPAEFVLHDVGTLTTASGGRLGGLLSGIDTPSLLGAWDSASYLHDGSAATLFEVLTTKNPNDRHGATSALSPNQLVDLAAYLQSLDGSPVDEPTDGDRDGLPDQWENWHGLDPSDSTDAANDLDRDGSSNQDEFIAGTNPRDASSRLAIHEVSRDANGVTVFFPTAIGRSYAGEFSDSIPTTNWTVFANLNGDGAEQSLADPTPPASRRFYRIRVSTAKIAEFAKKEILAGMKR